MTQQYQSAARTVTVPLCIPVHPYLQDHRARGRVVLPAVELLQHMARAVTAQFPRAGVSAITGASFDRFLPVEAGAAEIRATCELQSFEDGSIEATLATSLHLKSAAATRLLVHAAARFGARTSQRARSGAAGLAFNDAAFRVPAERLYSELVPFGPAFHIVQDAVMLTEQGAQAPLLAHDIAGASGPLGSPFPFDGSLHAACSWGQRFCGIVAFPVGFDERMILEPIAPGEAVRCTALPVAVHEGVIRFDIFLHDAGGRLRETAAGVVMRDISGGCAAAPAWVRSSAPLGPAWYRTGGGPFPHNKTRPE